MKEIWRAYRLQFLIKVRWKKKSRRKKIEQEVFELEKD